MLKNTKQQKSKIYKFQQRKKKYIALNRKKVDEVISAEAAGISDPAKSLASPKIGEGWQSIIRAKDAQLEKKKTVKYQLNDEAGSMSGSSSS